MEEKATLIESLFEKAEIYAKINFEIFRLKAIDKSADVISSIVAKIAIIILVLLIVLLLNIALSLWIGELVGKSYYGFLIVAGFYILVALILHYKRGILLKAPINDSIILHMINEKEQ
ncbi:MAG: hypothetical protein ABI844_02010 [Saprospiraceae bacterium]